MRRSSSGRGRGRRDPGRKVLSLIHAMLLGRRLHRRLRRAARRAHRGGPRHCAMVPSTLGTFFARSRSGTSASSTACSAKRCDARGRQARARHGAAGDRCRQLRRRGPRPPQAGRRLRLTHRLGYHPIVATRADTSEVMHVRPRNGAANTQRCALRFVDELLARVRRAGATGPILLRADSGFGTKASRACASRAAATRAAPPTTRSSRRRLR